MEVAITNHMHVKHGTKAHFVLKSGNLKLEDSWIPIEQVGGHITLVGIMYNRQAVSGGVSWWNPSTGGRILTPKYTITVDDSMVLKDGTYCDCADCLASAC